MTQRYFHFDPVVVGPGVKTGLAVLTDNPREVGADRIVNAVGAYARYGGPCIVIDLGTATVVATGGLAEVVVPHCNTIDHHDPWLTLEGLRIIFERNTGSA